MPVLDRRQTLQGLTAMVSAAAAPGMVLAAEDWAARLESDLEALVRPGADTGLTLIRFTMDAPGAMSAVVEMAWQPGTRRRPIRVEGRTPAACYAALLAGILTTFAAENPAGFPDRAV